MTEKIKKGWGADAPNKVNINDINTKVLTRADYFTPNIGYIHKQGLKILIWGEPLTGKTFFCLTAPPPIYAISTEFGIGPVLRHFPDKEIYIHEAAILDPETDEPDVNESLKKLELAIGTLKDIETGTIVIDSGTDVWQWLGAWVEQEARKAGKMTSIGSPQRLQWGRANLRWRQLILRLMVKPVHFIITAQVSEKYNKSGEPTGDYYPRIQRQTGHIADIVLHVQKEFKHAKDGKTVEEGYMATMTKCRFQRSLDKKIEDVTFGKLTDMLRDDLGVMIPDGYQKDVE